MKKIYNGISMYQNNNWYSTIDVLKIKGKKCVHPAKNKY